MRKVPPFMTVLFALVVSTFTAIVVLDGGEIDPEWYFWVFPMVALSVGGYVVIVLLSRGGE